MSNSTGYLSYVSALLKDQEVVFIPGFGAFVAKYKPAKINSLTGIIDPPTKYIAFNERLNIHDSTFAQYLDEQTDTHYSPRLYDQFVNELKHDLNNNLVIVVPQVGRVFRDYEDVTHFMPDLDNLNSDIFGLPKLNYRPLNKTEGRLVSAGPKDSGNLRPVIATAASLALLIFFAWFAYANWMPNSNNLATNKTVDTTNEMSILDRVKSTKKTSSEVLAVEPATPIESEVEDSIPDESNTENSVGVDAVFSKAIIIVGAFGSTSNAIKMKSKVEKMGYAAYDDQPKKLQRIGVIIEYNSEEMLEEKLKLIRNEIADRAWILE